MEEVFLLKQGLPRKNARTRCLELLEKVRLGNPERVLASYPHQLSGGMAQRVSLARAFAVEPSVLLMDEPFANLDVDLKSSLISVLEGLIKDRGTTMIYVTHELPEALRLATRIVELTPEHTLRELDLSDRDALAREWLARCVERGATNQPSLHP
jgi:ABC-type nitrate/sulfonate/bicarbonate transport system ATPase subunit